MRETKNNSQTPSGQLNNPRPTGFSFESEDERLLKDILRPDIEKLQLFTRMIKRNVTLKKFRTS